MKAIIKIIIPTLIVFFALIGCNKDKSSYGHMVVNMKDAPIEFKEVNVDIREVQVHYSGNESGWKTLNTNTGLYDLLKLQDGVTAVIADEEELPIGKVTQIRLILGVNNTVLTQDTIYPLELSSQDKTGLKLNTNFSVFSNKTVKILVDFDAEKSIVVASDSTFKLKPVLKIDSVDYL